MMGQKLLTGLGLRILYYSILRMSTYITILAILHEDLFDEFFSNDKIAFLEKPFSQEEILRTLKQIKGRKSPGPNGLQACFLQKYWTVACPKGNKYSS